MSDMWAAASKDIEAERKEKATAMAAVALGQFAPFLFEAKTKSEFTTRMALQQTKIAEALQDATEDEDARKAAIDQMTSDFDEALSRREVEAAKAKEEADRKAKVAKALDQRKAKVGHRRQSSVTYTVRANDRDKGSATGTGSSVGEALDALPSGFLTPVAFGRQTIIEDLEVTGKSTHGTTDFFVSLPHSAKAAARHVAANDISAGDWISSHEILPDLREGKGFINFLGGRAAKVVKVQNLEQAFGRQWDRYGVVDAAHRIEDWLDVSLGDDGRGYGKVWVATLEDGEIVPLDAEGVWSDKFPKRVSEPPIPGQQSFNFAHRDERLAVGHRRQSSVTHVAADEIKAGDYIVAKGGLPDLRDGQSRKVMLTTNRPGKVTKIETFDEAFPKGFQRYDWIDAKEKFERFLGAWDDPYFDLDNHGDDVWVAHLDSGEIVPLDAARYYSDRFPTRSNGPQIPGQRSWNFAHREAAERLPLRIKMAGEERLPLRIKMANPYSDANPYAQTRQQAPAAPAPQVTVNVAPPNNEGPSTPNNDDEERQRRARDKINQTQMTQDLTASREALAVTLAKKILREHPGATKKQALRVAKATMDRHPALVSHALSRVSSREPKESSPR